MEALATDLELDFVESHRRLEEVEAQGRAELPLTANEADEGAAVEPEGAV